MVSGNHCPADGINGNMRIPQLPDEKAHGHGLCSGHRRQKNLGYELAPLGPVGFPAGRANVKKRASLESKLWAKVVVGDGCCEWQGTAGPLGYGRIKHLGKIAMWPIACRGCWQMATSR